MPSRVAPRDDFRRDPGDGCIIRDIFRHHRARTDYGPTTDLQAWQNDRTTADERALADCNTAADICAGGNGYEAPDRNVVSDRTVYVQLAVSAD
jgi:hypothetical protein